jgi:VWFA-related protein
MRARFVALPLCAALAVPSTAASAQQTPPSKPAAPAAQGTEVPTFEVGTAAVTLDVVVRDKKDRAVPGLTAADFEVYEDGVLQRIESFEVFGRPAEPAPETSTAKSQPAPDAATGKAQPGPATSAAASTSAPPAAADSTVRPQVIAFVFDRLSPDARNIARKAALTYANRGHVEGDLVGVFGIDLALHTLQPFTNDLGLIRAGLDRAGSTANTAFADNRAQAREMLSQATMGQAVADAATGANPGQGGSAADIGSQAGAGALQNAILSVQAGMIRSFEALERDQQGFASTNGLLSVVNGLKRLPGRKTVVFFSEGLAIPSNVKARFSDVIASANRANVSVYTMDAAGLRTESMAKETRDEMEQAMRRRQQVLESGRDDAGGAMTKSLERNEDLLTLDPSSGLGRLANETGGFLIQNTNDAASAFRRIEEDMRFHYLLGYTPSNENYDGKFRAINVKVKRSGVKVQGRQGYFALKSIEAAPVRSFEAPAIAKLDSGKRPRDFDLDVTGLSFPSSDRPGLSAVLVRAPGGAPTFAPDKADRSGQKMHRADFSVVVRIRKPGGGEVDRVSQNYPLSVAEASLDAARSGDILFYRELDLPPGRYALEAVGYDAVSQKASIETGTLDVPKAEPGRPRLSSVVLVGRAEKTTAGEEAANPLYFGDTILYPRMGEPFRRSADPAVSFFFTVYGTQPGTSGTKAVVEVLRGDAPAGRVTADLPAADANGRIQYAGGLPLNAFAPGSYRLRVSAAGSEARETPFTVVE